MVSIADIVFKVLFGLNVVAAQVGGAALLSNLAHVAMFVFICPARRKCFPKEILSKLQLKMYFERVYIHTKCKSGMVIKQCSMIGVKLRLCVS